MNENSTTFGELPLLAVTRFPGDDSQSALEHELSELDSL